MAEINEELALWFEKFKKIPPGCHLLCPKVSSQDDEDYKSPNEPSAHLSTSEKQTRIAQGDERIETTYWNSLIFGFSKEDAGKWLDDFTHQLESALKQCSECVLNWHMKRSKYIRKFTERWNEETASHFEGILDRLDVARIDHNLAWIKDYMEKIEATGAAFKKSQLGENLTTVLITVYEALCCVSYIATPEQRKLFQYVFIRMQGKSYLKLGAKDPLPGMTFFLFDAKFEDRFKWAMENWKYIPNDSMTDEQFDWAVSAGLVKGINEVSKIDPSQAMSDACLEIESFWQAIECILPALTGSLVLSRLRSLELRPGSPDLYDLLFRHIQFCRSEGVLVVAIRILSALLVKSPKAIWDVVGDARPNVITDLLFGSPVYKTLLQQSLQDCWYGPEHGPSHMVPFSTCWIQPWLQSLNRDRMYDACEVLMHTLFETLAKDASIGEAGQAACTRAGFDALSFTIKSFLVSKTGIAPPTTHLYASAAFNLVVKHRDVILANMRAPRQSHEGHEGWTTFKVADAAKAVLDAAMRLEMSLISDEYMACLDVKAIQSTVTRSSQAYWECIIEMLDMSRDRVGLAKDILSCLEPLISIEQIRPTKKSNILDASSQRFNTLLQGVSAALGKILARVSEFNGAELDTLFADRCSFQALIGLSVNSEPDLAEAAVEVLKTWTSELSRDSTLEYMTQHHTEQTLSCMIWTMDRIVKEPWPWGSIRSLRNMSSAVLRGLADPSLGVLRTSSVDAKLSATILRWWHEQWRFISMSCTHLEFWSSYISNNIMTDFCREIMELAEQLIAEDGLLASTTAQGRSGQEAMIRILRPAKDNFQGMENMIRLKDRYLVDVTVRVLCKILSRLKDNHLDINAHSRRLIIDACVLGPTGKYERLTNLLDHQRAELLQALGYEEDVQVVKVGAASQGVGKEKAKKQSKLDAWSKSGVTGTSLSATKSERSNRDDVLELSRSADSSILKQIAARQAQSKASSSLKPSSKGPDVKAINALKESRQREKAERARRDAEAIARARQLRGETVGSDVGKLAKSEIMVNSDDESEQDGDDEDDDMDNQLAAISTGGQAAVDEEQKRRQLALQGQLRRPVKKIRQERSAKDMRARLVPSMERLHNTVLSWDLFHQGNEPPNGPAASKVEGKYADPKSYQATFFPLLASEAWRSFVTSKDETTSGAFGMKIVSRATVDSFLEATFAVPFSESRERGFGEGDIMLVSEDERPLANGEAKHCLARVHRMTHKKDLVEITYQVSSRGNALTQELRPGAVVHGIKITNMTTIEREYAALESLQHYDLMDEILKAEASPILSYGEQKVKETMATWDLNKAQALAVLGANENDGFTLIQGPPGTGKTKTIVAMVGALLSEQLKHQGTAGATSSGTGRSKKLLVCAPSNAAVDELVLRLKGGVTTTSGKAHKIQVLRLGRSDVINAAVKDVTLDELVRARLEGDTTRERSKADREQLHQEAARIRDELNMLKPRLEVTRVSDDRAAHNSLSRQFDELKRQQMQVGKQIEASRDSGNSVARELELGRRRVQQELLNAAQVLCATLSGSGHEMLRKLDVEFETVIIDEAAQCVELSALIPLKYGCCRCILVGDPKQLPPTVLSQSAARFGYDQSLFVRMYQSNAAKVHMLNTQYRMHPDISAFASREFYEGQLRDGARMAQLRRRPWHQSHLLGPYRFFDVEGAETRGRRGQSLVNTHELAAALQLYHCFSSAYGQCDTPGTIGVITPYKAQLAELKTRFKARYGDDITDKIEFNTTDAFQGRECEIIILSCVRASPTGGIGFMTDIRRMNVGLTRAKSSLWILGDSRALVQGEFWRKLVHDAQARNRYTKGDIVGLLRQPLQQAMDAEGDVAMGGTTMPLTRLPDAAAADDDDDGDGDEAPVAATAHSSSLESCPKASLQNPLPPRPQQPLQNPLPPRPEQPLQNQLPPRPKRPLENPLPETMQPAAKKLAQQKPRGLSAKFAPKAPPRPPPAPKDPSALAVLGLTPPERPPASTRPWAAQQQQQQPSSSLPAAGSNSNNMVQQQQRDGLIVRKKKAKPSVFLPKKR
ncbi:hypothetical protein CDD82_4008 [Ophiocordyceps australis]|uniref:UvrD-like helicase ATP-binding domain-containing protein n=1 Tax=Ophiocordyceps australis TaxID=1399860 RepID=A0A2C5Z9F2_9HYPO|nr:hypothetical protein CDD82_4008 [Ophiocordyceps australis]